MDARRAAALVLGVVTLAIALRPLVSGGADLPTPEHHLWHGALLAGAAASALLLTRPGDDAQSSQGRYLWLLLAVVAPIAAMFLMWPSEYALLDRNPGGHVLEHLGLVALGFLTAYAGQRYARGVGWLTAGGAIGMALVSAAGYGVSPPPAG